MSDTIYLGRDGQQMGPYAWAQIAAMASSGQVRPGVLAWHEGMAGWLPAETVLTRLGLSVVRPSFTRAPLPPVAPGGPLARLFAKR